MFSKVLLIILAAVFLLPVKSLAVGPSYVTIVNPIRGEEFWDLPNQTPIYAVKKQLDYLSSKNIPATWLLRFDALENKEITSLLKTSTKQEKGLFLEITPNLAKTAKVSYRPSKEWFRPPNIFLTGFSLSDRYKIIDTLFVNFKTVFGSYPTSVGAWWIDASSLKYMQEKYGITAGMIVADQFSTDSYQIWGQYWGAPYYPYDRNVLIPARSESEKIPVVITQWAVRDPFNGYGRGVEDSTYSVQSNDYLDYHHLDINYFGKLFDIYTKQKNPIGQLTIGLENSFDWNKYGNEYEKQIDLITSEAITMYDFAAKYKKLFPEVSPAIAFYSQDPLGTNSSVVWFMNPYYRAGLFINRDGVFFRDIREYAGNEELCLQKACSEINFAKSFISSVDEVSFGKNWVVDEGSVTNIKYIPGDGKAAITYTNQKGINRTIELLPHDIVVDGKPTTISQSILNVTHNLVPSKPFSYHRAEGLVGSEQTGNFLTIIWNFLQNLFRSFLNKS